MQQDRLGASPNWRTALAPMTGFYSGYVCEVIPASFVIKTAPEVNPEVRCDEYESGLLRVRAGGLPDTALRPLRKCGHTVSSLQRLRARYEVEQLSVVISSWRACLASWRSSSSFFETFSWAEFIAVKRAAFSLASASIAASVSNPNT